jgi:hypothetical protein
VLDDRASLRFTVFVFHGLRGLLLRVDAEELRVPRSTVADALAR